MAGLMRQAEPLVTRYGDDEKATALAAIRSIEARAENHSAATRSRDPEPALAPAKYETNSPGTASQAPVTPHSPAEQERSRIRDDVYRIIAELRHAIDTKGISAEDKKIAESLSKRLGSAVEYAPVWVRMLSAVCLGLGTMIGYRRIVKTLGERLGNVHLTPAQGASAEVVSALLIGTAGFTGLPVSTTHIVTSGIGGTMVSSGAGLRYRMISRIVIAWVFTLPVTILISGGLYYLLASPRL
jgi:PiT family inorganic phosphate transporter